MAIPLQAFTALGAIEGTVAASGRLGELLETVTTLAVRDVRLAPLDGGPLETAAGGELPVDELLFVLAPPDTPTLMHAAWHPLSLVLGPYRIEAELPTLPGFDPARALARPGGQFVLVGRASVGLVQLPDEEVQAVGFGWVDRYAVDRVAADIDLSLFFPGAHIEVRAGGLTGA
ncbi:MAG TPA: hypothetical protein VF763_07795 [Candidatus Limnocylindrales bacterium]